MAHLFVTCPLSTSAQQNIASLSSFRLLPQDLSIVKLDFPDVTISSGNFFASNYLLVRLMERLPEIISVGRDGINREKTS